MSSVELRFGALRDLVVVAAPEAFINFLTRRETPWGRTVMVKCLMEIHREV
jgi:hypothetical protein